MDWKYIISTLVIYRRVYLLYTWKCTSVNLKWPYKVYLKYTFINLKCSNLVQRSIKLVYFLVCYKYMVQSIFAILTSILNNMNFTYTTFCWGVSYSLGSKRQISSLYFLKKNIKSLFYAIVFCYNKQYTINKNLKCKYDSFTSNVLQQCVSIWPVEVRETKIISHVCYVTFDKLISIGGPYLNPELI